MSIFLLPRFTAFIVLLSGNRIQGGTAPIRNCASCRCTDRRVAKKARNATTSGIRHLFRGRPDLPRAFSAPMAGPQAGPLVFGGSIEAESENRRAHFYNLDL